MRIKLVFMILIFSRLFIGDGQCGEVFDYKNLEGLQKVNERITIESKLSGDEPFNLEETKIKQIIFKKLDKLKIQIDKANESDASFNVNIEGVTTGGGGARFSIQIAILSRISSPFKPENKIFSIIWSKEKTDEQTMSYNREKKKVVLVKGKLNERVYATIEKIMNAFQYDYKMANTK